MVEPTIRRFLVRAGIERRYGQHSVYFEISEEVDAKSTGEVREAYNGLLGLLDDQIKTYETVSLPHVILPKQTGAVSGASGQANTFPVDTIKVEFVDGKKQVKACGGSFVKHGVPVYKECKESLGIESMDYGIHDVKHLGLTATIEYVNGKPKRVLSIS